MDCLFLDANVLFSAAWSSTNQLRSFWDRQGIELLSSAYCVEEAQRNLQEHKPKAVPDLIVLCSQLMIVSEADRTISLPDEMSLPEKDVPVFLAALASQATHFITGDFRHFGLYRGQTLGGVTIMAPADYLNATDVSAAKKKKS